MSPSPSLMRPDRSHALDEAYLLVCWYAKVRLEFAATTSTATPRRALCHGLLGRSGGVQYVADCCLPDDVAKTGRAATCHGKNTADAAAK